MLDYTMDKGSPSTSRKVIDIFGPADGKKIGEVPVCSGEDALNALHKVHAAQKKWAHIPIEERCRVIKAFARILLDRSDEVARLLSAENGKPLYESYTHEVFTVIHLASYFARRAKKVLKPKPLPLWIFKNRTSYIHYRPLGVTSIISPWNFPFTIPAGAVIMNLLAGNGVLLKPASLTPLIAYKMRELFDEAGLDPNLFQVVAGPGRMAQEVIEKGSGLIGFVNFTGSTEIGRVVASVCGQRLIPCSMELGGKDPAIICADADIALAARSVVMGAFGNSGQICASVERVYAHTDIYDAFVKEAVRLTKRLRQGHPLENCSTDLGAMTSEEQVLIVQRQIQDTVSKGAKILTGGRRLPIEGRFFEPTVLVDVTPDMEVIAEETFGPLLPVMRVHSDEEAIKEANKSVYGLCAYVFTKNTRKGRRIAEQLEAGTVMVNETIITHGFPETPWQGFKASGLGRVHSDEGLKDLCLACHVNYDTMPIPRILWDRFWVWHPYDGAKISRFRSLYGLCFVPADMKTMLGRVMNMLRPKPVEPGPCSPPRCDR
jgi:succinate-semialdehyde dehydrogenase/glutarate-semialdehyde dehydrogenase